MNKLPPQSIEMEESILSTLLLYPDKLADIEILQPSDFYRSSHQKIFKAIISSENIDLVSIVTKLKEWGQLEDVGGATYLAKLTDEVPVASSIEYYAEKVIEKARLREMINRCNEIINKCFEDSGDAIEVIDAAQASINSVTMATQKPNFTTYEEMVDTATDRYANPQKQEIYRTGFPKLDYLVNVTQGDLIIIAGRPAMGKTSLAKNFSINMAKRGIMNGLFSLEASKERWIDSSFSQETGISISDLNSGKMSQQQWDRLVEKGKFLYELPIIIDDTSPLAISELKRRARMMVKMGCKVIFIDQLNKIRSGKKLDRWNEATENTIEIGYLAKELRVPVFLLAQLNRKLEERATKRPILSDLKNSGALEEEAHVVILLFRNYYYSHNENEKRDAEIIVAKNRNGATGFISCNFDNIRTLFTERDETYDTKGGYDAYKDRADIH